MFSVYETILIDFHSHSIRYIIKMSRFFQSNFFSALDDSDNEGAPAPAVAAKKKAPKKEVVEPSKVENRP